MGYGDSKDLTRRTASDKVLRDKAFSIATNSKYDRYQRGDAFLIKRLLVEQLKMKICIINNQPKNYTNQIIKKFKNKK